MKFGVSDQGKTATVIKLLNPIAQAGKTLGLMSLTVSFTFSAFLF